jgi:single-stranded-DNA-specific exonuclease
MSRRKIIRRNIRDDILSSIPMSLHPVLRRVYGARAIDSAVDLELGLDRLLPVGSLDGIEAGVDLLLRVFRSGGRVMVIGDFDADGATSTALVLRQLHRLEFVAPTFLVPDRFKYGYGLSPEIVRVAAKQEPHLLVTVDNGISSQEGVAEARRLGIDVLVTDHHLQGDTLPDAAAIINPNLRGSLFGSRNLAGVGVAFYLMAALTRAMRDQALLHPGVAANPADLLDLVALGTVADVVPLDLNNRILVAQGLRRIRAGRCTPGLRALLQGAGRRLESVTSQDLAFQAGPRLNAAGRMTDMTIGINCLLAPDERTAGPLAQQLAQLNAERREVESRMQQEAFGQVDSMFEATGDGLPSGVCVFDGGWHQGVIGLVASRVRERLHRPVIAFAPGDEGSLKGSARSVPGVHVRDVLDAVAKRRPDLLQRFGGHAMAAGMTISEHGLDDFRALFAEEVERWVDPGTLDGDLYTDGELQPGEFNIETAAALREGGPWGAGFPEPSFDGHFRVDGTRVVGERHLKLRLKSLSGESVDAIAFRYLDDSRSVPPRAGDEIEMVYKAALNEYAGTCRLQLVSEWLGPL